MAHGVSAESAPGATADASRASPAPPFVRRPPPFVHQLLYGSFVYGVLTPVVWTLERMGLAAYAMGCALKRRERASRALDPFLGYVPGPQDVFVANYAKSGTNWVLQIVQQLAHHGAAEFEHIHDVVPWPEARVLPWVFRDYAVPLESADAWTRSPESLRAIKTHLAWEFLPVSDRAHYVTVIRDPKDVFVSSFHFFRDSVLGPAMPSVASWLTMFLRGRTMGGSWAINANSCWVQRDRPNLLLLSFKSMRRDLPGTVRRMAEFLEVAATPPILAAVTEKASFAHMKRIDHKFAVGRVIPWRKPGAMMRQGSHGASSELLTLDQRRAIDAHALAELRALGSDLPYDDFADRA